MERRAGLASEGAASSASVPDATKKTFASGSMQAEVRDPLGQLDLVAVQIQRGTVDDPAHLISKGVGDRRVVVADHRREDPREQVEIGATLGVRDVPTLARDQLDRLRVVRHEP